MVGRNPGIDRAADRLDRSSLHGRASIVDRSSLSLSPKKRGPLHVVPVRSAIDWGRLLLSAVDQSQNPQETETFQVNDRTGDYRRDGNLRLETTFFSKASYF